MGFPVDKEEITSFADRIINRCNTVCIKIITTRNEDQKKCLTKIDQLINNMVRTSMFNFDEAKNTCQLYLASCSPMENGIVHKDFETVILGCTLDDQKYIYKRLRGFMDYIEQTEKQRHAI